MNYNTSTEEISKLEEDINSYNIPLNTYDPTVRVRNVYAFMQDILELNERRLKAWASLKEWISNNCFFDGDTITYEDIINEMNRLEDKIYD